MNLHIPLNLNTGIWTVAILITVALWVWYDAEGKKDAFGLGGFLVLAATCFIWMVVFGLLLLLHGCAA